MQRQRLVVVEQQVERLVELDLAATGQLQPIRRTDALQRRFDRVRLDRVGAMSLETEQHGAVRAVPAAGERE